MERQLEILYLLFRLMDKVLFFIWSCYLINFIITAIWMSCSLTGLHVLYNIRLDRLNSFKNNCQMSTFNPKIGFFKRNFLIDYRSDTQRIKYKCFQHKELTDFQLIWLSSLNKENSGKYSRVRSSAIFHLNFYNQVNSRQRNLDHHSYYHNGYFLHKGKEYSGSRKQ